ncbi:hypothetical protein S101258_00953 [Lactiplantibacillus plantarum subsp. plantarum]|uniref:Uncharacterized protein n=1 Tax=Lactiplantibacillus plantarum subsp. plantarum TaxID=337330 RepID=A0A2S3U897_LACPN|nr:hypothetical protein S101258_00953 [Lactiplantibacillus plantarum subsp. plantarum]
MSKVGFGVLNWVVLGAYLLAMLGVGAYFTRKASKNTDSFSKQKGIFLLGRRGSVFTQLL